MGPSKALRALSAPTIQTLSIMEEELSNYEALALIVSCISAFIAVLAIAGNRKLQKESNDLQRATSKLAEKQLSILEQKQNSTNSARVKLDLIKEGKGQFKFYLTNISEHDARQVNLSLILDNPSNDPIIKSEYKQKLPVPVLSPGSSVSLIAALHLGSPTAYNALVTWVNPNGQEESYETYAAL